jgi:hypothetical protein
MNVIMQRRKPSSLTGVGRIIRRKQYGFALNAQK